MTPTQNDQNADAASPDLEAIKARAAAAPDMAAERMERYVRGEA